MIGGIFLGAFFRPALGGVGWGFLFAGAAAALGGGGRWARSCAAPLYRRPPEQRSAGRRESDGIVSWRTVVLRQPGPGTGMTSPFAVRWHEADLFYFMFCFFFVVVLIFFFSSGIQRSVSLSEEIFSPTPEMILRWPQMKRFEMIFHTIWKAPARTGCATRPLFVWGT